MLKKGVSDELYSVIQKLMNEPIFDDFLLGGGTNLAIKYNHRLSVDIDLFSTEIVGTKKLNLICEYLINEFGDENVLINKLNFESEQLAWLQINLLIKEEIKIDIIQNLKLIEEKVVIGGIRLINDIDIGALKLMAAADRGNQKDFYDLYLLSEKKDLSIYYDALQKRIKDFPDDKDKTIFDIQKDKPLNELKTSLIPLGNFNNAGDKKNTGNRIELTMNSPININWPTIRELWLAKVKKLSEERGLIFERTKHVRKNKGFLGLFKIGKN
jgi:predicted nucleotidyltransferase component of viral defense system